MPRTYGPLTLPSGKVLEFREPLGVDKDHVLKMVNISQENIIGCAMLIDDYVAAKCVKKVDGKATSGEYKTLFSDWSQADVLFYKRVFERMFGMNEDRQKSADEAADFLLNSLTSTDGASLPKPSESLSKPG
ncbi:hypothetical protein [Desulforamulus ruminis]|uniref:Uncharacterized protein n=1 Tax=Desulforamulus ruminis (strain ATCC 23193 / DSM 2154 / NCIMB 8452 / DL) TaxID=696281 RepID=F6DTF4_DESRL|nr:hypothetical protein [Desulforamulus ruminis]AEG60016.1 hypothetical protein Desru_1752 [Desulforamulus ruminis DSM 2154]